MGKQWKQCQTLFFWAPESLQMVTAAMKLKDTWAPWKESYDQPRQHIKKQRPIGKVWGGRREEDSGWGTHVYLWQIHVDLWQNQYDIVKLKNKIKNKTNEDVSLHQTTGSSGTKIPCL